jgi:hypothetical protein
MVTTSPACTQIARGTGIRSIAPSLRSGLAERPKSPLTLCHGDQTSIAAATWAAASHHFPALAWTGTHANR